MNTLASPDSVRSNCNLPATTIIDTLLTPHIESASIEVRRLLTDDVYEEVLVEALTDNEDSSDPTVDLNTLEEDVDLDETTTTTRALECCKAESLFAFAYALPFLNIETAGKGIVTAKGWDSSRSELMSQNEVQKFIDKVREQAAILLEPYLPVLDNDLTDEEEAPILHAGGISMITI